MTFANNAINLLYYALDSYEPIGHTNCMQGVLWHNVHRITVSSQQGQKLLNFSENTIKLHNSTTNNNFEKKIISDMHHRTTYMHSNFQQIRVSRLVKTVQTNLFAQNCKAI